MRITRAASCAAKYLGSYLIDLTRRRAYNWVEYHSFDSCPDREGKDEMMANLAWGLTGILIGYILRSIVGMKKAETDERKRLLADVELMRHAGFAQAKHRVEKSHYFKTAREKVLGEIRDKLNLCYSNVIAYDEKAPVSDVFVESVLISFVNSRSAVRIAPEEYLREDGGLDVMENTLKELLMAANTIDEREGGSISRENVQEAHAAATAWLEKHMK